MNTPGTFLWDWNGTLVNDGAHQHKPKPTRAHSLPDAYREHIEQQHGKAGGFWHENIRHLKANHHGIDKDRRHGGSKGQALCAHMAQPARGQCSRQGSQRAEQHVPRAHAEQV